MVKNLFIWKTLWGHLFFIFIIHIFTQIEEHTYVNLRIHYYTCNVVAAFVYAGEFLKNNLKSSKIILAKIKIS